MKTIKIEIKKLESNGGEWFVYTDGKLKGVYGTKQRLEKALAEIMEVVE